MINSELTQEEIDHIFNEQIIPRVLTDIEPSLLKKGYVLGGQPGSGKSTLAIEIIKKDKNIVFVNADDLRPFHPHYFTYLKENDEEAATLTQKTCATWAKMLGRECMTRGLNVIIEGTMRTKESPLIVATELKKYGYLITAAVISVPYDISLFSTRCRYSELKKNGYPARYTKKEAHDVAYENIEASLIALLESDLFDEFQIYQRVSNAFEGKIFTKNEKKEIMTCFKAGRARELSDSEKEMFKDMLDKNLSWEIIKKLPLK